MWPDIFHSLVSRDELLVINYQVTWVLYTHQLQVCVSCKFPSEYVDNEQNSQLTQLYYLKATCTCMPCKKGRLTPAAVAESLWNFATHLKTATSISCQKFSTFPYLQPRIRRTQNTHPQACGSEMFGWWSFTLIERENMKGGVANMRVQKWSDTSESSAVRKSELVRSFWY